MKQEVIEVSKLKKAWLKQFNNYKLAISKDDLVDNLEVGVYEIHEDPFGNLSLEKVQNKFEFGYKIYGAETTLIDRVYKTYNSTVGNLGILLNGIKGTGKTVTAKLLANKFNIPVLLVNRPYKGFNGFISELGQDVVLLFDEFEKNFSNSTDEDGQESGSQPILLTLMDGIYSDAKARKIFILTTNQDRLNENFIERPSRIRYIKKFGNLTRAAVTEIVEDIILNKDLTNATINFICKLNLITIDIVKAVVNEVNIHNEDPEKFKDIFNVKEADITISIRSNFQWEEGDDVKFKGESVEIDDLDEVITVIFKNDSNFIASYLETHRFNLSHLFIDKGNTEPDDLDYDDLHLEKDQRAMDQLIKDDVSIHIQGRSYGYICAGSVKEGWLIARTSQTKNGVRSHKYTKFNVTVNEPTHYQSSAYGY